MRRLGQELTLPYRWQWVSILFSVCAALCLSVAHWPTFMAWFRPQWVLLVLFFWSIQSVSRLHIVFVWCVGLYLDLLLGTVLGLHALLCVLLFFVGVNNRRVIGSLPLWQQVLFVFMFSMVMQVICFCVFRSLGHIFFLSEIVGNGLMNALVWPCVVWSLRPYVHVKGRY